MYIHKFFWATIIMFQKVECILLEPNNAHDLQLKVSVINLKENL